MPTKPKPARRARIVLSQSGAAGIDNHKPSTSNGVEKSTETVTKTGDTTVGLQVPGPEQSPARAAESRAIALSAAESPLGAVVAGKNQGSRTSFTIAVKRNRRRKRVALGEALRREGIDEHMVAQTYAGVVDMLKGKTLENDSVEKLLVDILKECSKHLGDDTRPEGNTSVRVSLIHNVARPKRERVPLAQPQV